VYIYGSYHKIKTGYHLFGSLCMDQTTPTFLSLTTMVHNKTYYIGTGT